MIETIQRIECGDLYHIRVTLVKNVYRTDEICDVALFCVHMSCKSIISDAVFLIDICERTKILASTRILLSWPGGALGVSNPGLLKSRINSTNAFQVAICWGGDGEIFKLSVVV